MLRAKQQKQDTHVANLLTSLLLRFPEIMSINLDMPRERCKFTFMLHGGVVKEEFTSFKAMLKSSLAAYGELKGTMYDVKAEFERFGKISLVGITCGTALLSLELILLITALVEAEFSASMVRDPESCELCHDEEMVRQEEIIEYLLGQAGGHKDNLIAFREAGKVYVCDK